MEEIIKKRMNTIISIFILLSPILDLLTGLNLHYLSFPITIGMVVRLIFLITVAIIVIKYYHKSKAIVPYLIIGLFSIFFLIGLFINKEESYLFKEIQNIIKFFYFPLLFSSLFFIRKEIKISKLVLFTTLYLYLIFVFVPTLLNIGFKSYEITKAGTLGFYHSANEISGIISILTPIMFIIFKKIKKVFPKIFLICLYLPVILMIGTKTPLLSLIITIMITIIYDWIKWLREKEIKKIILSILVIIIGIISMILIIPRTNFYKNIKTHLDFLGVDDIGEIVKEERIIDHFIFSQRLTFLHRKANIYNSANLYQKLFGIGAYENDLELKAIEMDYFDIYFNYGIIGFIIYFGIVLTLLYKILITETKRSYERFMMDTSLIIIILLSLLTGHIITAPSVSLLVVIIIFSLNEDIKRRIIILGERLNSKEKKLIDNIKKEEDTILDIYLQKKDKNINKIPNNYLKILFFKILNYQNYDISIYIDNKEEIGKEIGKMSALEQAIYVKKVKQEYEDYKWVISEEKANNKKIIYYEEKIILE